MPQGFISETTPPPSGQDTPIAPTPDQSLMDYTFANMRLRNLINNWESGELKATYRRRRIRDIKVNVEDLRNRGKLKSDETYVPIRMIDTNIRREQPAYVQYLTQSRRTAIFKCHSEPQLLTEKLEAEFTRVTRYTDWELPFLRCLDGAMMHGYDAMEIVEDSTKPGGVAIEHIGHENLLFPMDARNIQQCEYVIRVYWCSILRLRSMATEFKFNSVEIEQLIKRIDGSGNTSTTGTILSGESLLTVYKVLFKYDGRVYVGWYHVAASDWLKAPAPLDLGRKTVQQPTPDQLILNPAAQPITITQVETEYPIELLYYQESEKPEILAHYGRGMLDEYKQEASSSILSAYVNGAIRASNVFGAPGGNTDTGGATPKQTNVVLEGGKMYDAPMQFFTMPYPSPEMLKGVQFLDTQNASETNQVAWAVNNREDSRKTATEIQASQQQTSQISTVTVTLFASFVRRVYSRVWTVVQSLALQNVFPFLQLPGPVDPLTGQPGPAINDSATLSKQYDIRAAGDVDVIERQEVLQRRMQFWPVVQAIPGLSGEFLSDIIKTAFPDDSTRYIQAMQQGSMKNNVIQALSQMLQAAVMKPDGSGVEDHFKGMEQQLMGLQQQVQQALQAPM